MFPKYRERCYRTLHYYLGGSGGLWPFRTREVGRFLSMESLEMSTRLGSLSPWGRGWTLVGQVMLWTSDFLGPLSDTKAHGNQNLLPSNWNVERHQYGLLLKVHMWWSQFYHTRLPLEQSLESRSVDLHWFPSMKHGGSFPLCPGLVLPLSLRGWGKGIRMVTSYLSFILCLNITQEIWSLSVLSFW